MRILAAFFLVALCLLGAPAFASHPSTPSWTTTVQTDDTGECLSIATPESDRTLLTVDNQCDDYLSVTAVRCDPDVCTSEGFGVENNSMRDLTTTDFGLNVGELVQDETVAVEFDWQLNEEQMGTFEFDVTFNGYSGGEHNFDTGVRPQPDAGPGGDDTGTAGGRDDAGASGGSGKGNPSGCGGCASLEGNLSAAAMLLFALVVLAVRRTRTRR